MSDRIADLASATRLISERAHLIGIIECCLMGIVQKDDLLRALAPRLVAEDRAAVDEKIAAQEDRLADAVMNLAAPSDTDAPSLTPQLSTIH